jgi:hypothetical protein
MELGRRQGTVEGWIFFRSAGGRFWPIASFRGNAANGRYRVDCVAKLPLRRLANDDSVG